MLAARALTVLALGAALASVRLVPSTRYRLIVLALGVTLLAIVPVLIALRLDAPGIGQRGFILVGLAWQVAFESHERSMGSAQP